MKLTTLSVLFSSLYFGLVSNVFAEEATLTFKESVDTACGVKMVANQEGTILFDSEEAASETYVKFTPISNDSGKQLSLTVGPFDGSIPLINGQNAVTNNTKLWVTANDSSQIDFDSIKAKYNLESGKEHKAIAVVNHQKSEIIESEATYTVTATIQLTCL
ncbi:hypothetical protein [Vibrio hepatarius]|uniref:hypothetical protein n=1 Tax=Vibrio hepatarius TaxID=171383 RepID=UPI001C09DBE4|nr:hypothetical protein [Vibrio hepatarius]MBU2896240.1 hypothetical protein [Vibrio hepatarius]